MALNYQNNYQMVPMGAPSNMYGTHPHDMYETHPHDMYGTHPHDMYGTHPHDMYGTHPHDMYGTHPHDVNETHPHDVNETHPHDVNETHPHDAHKTPLNNKKRHISKTTIIVHTNKWNTFSKAEKVNILLWPILVVLLIIAYIIYVMKFKGADDTIGPGTKKSKDPKTYIMYSGQKMQKCPNLKTIGVITNPNANNKTVYSITGNNHQYNNVITLASGRPVRGFYSCNQHGSCKTYKFISKNEKCTNGQSRKTLNKSDNCIGGYGCHYATTVNMGQQHLHTYCKDIKKTCPRN